MQKFTQRQYIEQFHLLFLDQLGQCLDKRLYALKGGCNLRFYFNSIRYSEDVDLDVNTIAVNTLKNKVNKILESTPFTQLLKLRQLEIMNISTPKQTNTTQRWKMQIKTGSTQIPIHTKIEFSKRQNDNATVLEPVASKLTQDYGLHPIFIPHYTPEVALKQKIDALLGRSETQARDVFDIFLLLQYVSNIEVIAEYFSEDHRQIAINNALNVSYDQFKSQVLSFLEPSYQLQYKDTAIWEKIQHRIIEMLS